MTKYVLAIDQGTTSSRAVLFDCESRVVAMAQEEYRQHYPRPGWVEHDPEDIWASVVCTCREAIGKAGATPKDLVALGIANQRETVVVWERATGKPIHNAMLCTGHDKGDLRHRLFRAAQYRAVLVGCRGTNGVAHKTMKPLSQAADFYK